MTKVCPNCGSEHFLAYESVRQEVLIDGEGSTIEIRDTLKSKRDEGIICKGCGISIDGLEHLVNESEFHENIAVDE
jgi:hypothetical protein